MIAAMWRLCLVLAIAACGGPERVDKGEPTTAKEKQLKEAKASGELDDDNKAWGKGWKYQGERNDCFFLVGKKCFKTEKQACAAAACKSPKSCKGLGGGPTQVACK